MLILEEFPLLVRGPQKGIGRTKNCGRCTEKTKQFQKRSTRTDKENIPPGPIIPQKSKKSSKEQDNNLPLSALADFISLLVQQRNVVDLEATVAVPSEEGPPLTADRKTRAKYIADKISGSMEYFFVYEISSLLYIPRLDN